MTPTTAKRKPFTKRERARMTQSGLGSRPTNNWWSGDLPAPWAEGDVVLWDGTGAEDRMRDMPPGHFVVTYATSVDEGDAWYFRLWDGQSEGGSDRLHVAHAARSTWDEDVDFMSGCTLVETADPDGLALRERLLAEGWTLTPAPSTTRCPLCGSEKP